MFCIDFCLYSSDGGQALSWGGGGSGRLGHGHQSSLLGFFRSSRLNLIIASSLVVLCETQYVSFLLNPKDYPFLILEYDDLLIVSKVTNAI